MSSVYSRFSRIRTSYDEHREKIQHLARQFRAVNFVDKYPTNFKKGTKYIFYAESREN